MSFYLFIHRWQAIWCVFTVLPRLLFIAICIVAKAGLKLPVVAIDVCILV